MVVLIATRQVNTRKITCDMTVSEEEKVFDVHISWKKGFSLIYICSFMYQMDK